MRGHCMSSSPQGRRSMGLINLLDWNSQNVWKARSLLPPIPLMKQHQNRRGPERRCNLCFQLQEYSTPQTAPCALHLSVLQYVRARPRRLHLSDSASACNDISAQSCSLLMSPKPKWAICSVFYIVGNHSGTNRAARADWVLCPLSQFISSEVPSWDFLEQLCWKLYTVLKALSGIK